MSTTIMMPQEIDAAIKDMCGDAMSQVVAALADKYGFDPEEANRFLNLDDIKLARKRGPASTKKEVATKKKTKKSTKSDVDKPKRAMTGYLLYSAEVRPETRAELTAALENDEKLKPSDVVVSIAARWKAESQDVRDEWNTKAKTPVTSDDEV